MSRFSKKISAELIDPSLPTVAIVGRPNVGKSSLFNALARRRLAITHSDEGVTHEGISCRCEHEGVAFTLKDTGGITDEGRFAHLIRERSERAMENAALLVLVLEAGFFTDRDAQICRSARKIGTPVILVVNKADNYDIRLQSQEAYLAGLGEPMFVSALHRDGVEELLDAICRALGGGHAEEVDEDEAEAADEDELDDEPSDERGEAVEDISNDVDISGYADGHKEADAELDPTPAPSIPRVLLLGKPNTGKSSLINYITGASYMVSDIPGTTRDVAHLECTYDGAQYLFIDTAGIRRKTKIENDVEYYASHRALEAMEESDVVILVVDASDGFSEQEKKLVSLASRRGKALVIALNKWDIVGNVPNRLQAEKDRLAYLFPQVAYAPAVAVSARTGFGVADLMKAALRVYRQLHARVATPRLNADVQRWSEEQPPPLIKQKRGKIKYVSQTGICPPAFKVRVNNPKLFPESYRMYIQNRIRRQYNFTEIPCRILFVSGSGDARALPRLAARPAARPNGLPNTLSAAARKTPPRDAVASAREAAEKKPASAASSSPKLLSRTRPPANKTEKKPAQKSASRKTADQKTTRPKTARPQSQSIKKNSPKKSQNTSQKNSGRSSARTSGRTGSARPSASRKSSR